MNHRKPPVPSSNVIDIDSLRSDPDPSSPAPPTAGNRTASRSFRPAACRPRVLHWQERRNIPIEFHHGESVRRLARRHRVPEADVEAELRAYLPPPAEIRRRQAEQARVARGEELAA